MFIDGKNGGDIGENGLAKNFEASARPTLTVDVRKYEAMLDDPSLSQQQKEEFLRALWSIVVSFVELGFGVHPLQEACGQESEISSPSAKEAFDQVESDKSVEIKDERDSGMSAGIDGHEYT